MGMYMSNNYNLRFILDKNLEYCNIFKQSALMRLIVDESMQNQEYRKRLLDCIQVFSNYFQKTVMLRFVLNDNPNHIKIAQTHLAEEFGHDVSLMRDRNEMEPIWDPILEASSAWFSWKMITLNNYEKTLLVHQVLEESANIFFVKANEVMLRYKETEYFKMHAEIDDSHASMGIKLLQDLTSAEYLNLAIIQQQGWDVLNVVCNRITELTRDRK